MTVASVRGSFVLASVNFVRRRHGDAGHERALDALAPAARVALEARLPFVRDSTWEPWDLAEAYMLGAKSALAAADCAFFQSMGEFAAAEARANGFAPMMGDVDTTIRMLMPLSRAFIDVGAPTVVSRVPHGLIVHLKGYPTSEALCERRIGAWRILLSPDGTPVSVEETLCTRRGHPFCELRIAFAAAPE
jgi:hypothetical protein